MTKKIIRKYLEIMGDEKQTQCGEMFNVIDSYIDFKFEENYKLIYSTQLKTHFVVSVDGAENANDIYTARHFYDNFIMKDDEYVKELYEERFNEILTYLVDENLIILKF